MATGTRWKGKDSQTKALSQPMSLTILDLQSSLLSSPHSKPAAAVLSGSSVLLEANHSQTELLTRACFGRPIITSDQNENKQWFQLGLEEAFYLYHSLKCLEITSKGSGDKRSGSSGCGSSVDELWRYMCSKMDNFPFLYKTYSYLRMKNWVVRSGSQYGVDYVAYRHHPGLVHSEYAVIVLSDEEESVQQRLKVWSDIHCSVRLCGSVAKTLLAVRVRRKTNKSKVDSVVCLEEFSVETRTISRWNPKQTREEKKTIEEDQAAVVVDEDCKIMPKKELDLIGISVATDQ